mmetsp:Transcript_22620/g.49639  ORF Transcript_22620/g.49639 Transcript_22620/m.49639 type:complete len:243 (-) Transcript_22620:150-878(-)
MLIPFEDSSPVDGEVPQVVKEVHSIFWWMLLSLFLALSVVRVVAEDVGGAFSSGLLALLVWCMIRDNCTKMTKVGCMLFIMVCTLQVFLDGITLCGSVGGRKKYTRLPSSGDDKRIVVTTVIESVPFFDASQGTTYNLQSATIVAAPALVALGVVLGYLSYSAFPSPPEEGYRDDDIIFLAPAAGGGRAYGSTTLGGGFGGGGGAGSSSSPTAANGNGNGNGLPREGGQAAIFAGPGRRLTD